MPTAKPTITHPELVKALLKPGSEIAANITPQEADLWHNATGVAGETGEILEAVMSATMNDLTLDHENMVEELGDLAFYLEGFRQNLGIDRDETLFYVGDRPAFRLMRESGLLCVAGSHLLDLTKKAVIYKKAIPREQFIIALASIERVTDQIRRLIGVTREQMLSGNIAKLSVRYAGITYSDAAAQARADKQGE
jgi:NTP pyrophosphatase (non-canonical NTP hydrolase)